MTGILHVNERHNQRIYDDLNYAEHSILGNIASNYEPSCMVKYLRVTKNFYNERISDLGLAHSNVCGVLSYLDSKAGRKKTLRISLELLWYRDNSLKNNLWPELFIMLLFFGEMSRNPKNIC
uniref:Uncharacterized protein n=1 Tax=Rhizophagus irregularis (strain DAOM 181602 / DAOM 197198 / MUCL 43194) TaxID=747089 RepID=U9SL98_RHIID